MNLIFLKEKETVEGLAMSRGTILARIRSMIVTVNVLSSAFHIMPIVYFAVILSDTEVAIAYGEYERVFPKGKATIRQAAEQMKWLNRTEVPHIFFPELGYFYMDRHKAWTQVVPEKSVSEIVAEIDAELALKEAI